MAIRKNTGRGLILDTLRNYYGVYSTRQSYSFSEYPDLSSVGLYFQDEFSGRLLTKRYEFIFGFRYDLFNPSSLNTGKIFQERSLVRTKHGEFFSPRINMRLFLSDNIRFRLGAGRSAKAVSLGYIYRPPEYFKFEYDTFRVEEMYPQENPNLQAYTTDKYEASLDLKLHPMVGLSLTGYYITSDNQPARIQYPWGYDVNPDTISSATYSIYRNVGWQQSSGAELVLRTKRIRNIQYRMNLTYKFSHSGRKGTTYDSSPDTSDGRETVWYKPPSIWYDKVIVDHQVNFISNKLGVWVTFDVQYIALDRKRNIFYSNHYTKYSSEYDLEYEHYQGMGRYYDNIIRNYNTRWRFDFRISKSIFRNTELSLYINNILDDRAIWVNKYLDTRTEKNPQIYYGMEVSSQW